MKPALTAASLGALILVSGAWAWPGLHHSPPLVPPPTPGRLAELRVERDELEDRLHEALVAHGETSLPDAPSAGVMIGIPTAFTTSIIEQVVTGLFGETTLTLRNLKAHAHGDVKAKVLFSTKTLGRFDLEVRIHEVHGLLKPGRPTVSFSGGVVSLVLPVHLASGSGNATLHLKWDSQGAVANTVCGDIDVTRKVGGHVVPRDYSVRGRFLVAAEGDTVVLRPEFPDLAVRIFVDPSDEAWAVLDGVVKDRPKGCEVALAKVDIKEKLGGVVGKGFNVKIPQTIFKPVQLPAGVRQSLEIQGIALALEVKPVGLLVARDRIWYGADLSIRANRAAAP